MLPTDCLHSLTVDFERAAAPVRAAFDFSAEDLSGFSCQAGRAGAPLLLICTSRALHLISTSDGHVRAFRPVLARIRERGQNVEGWRGLPVRAASGSDAARVLLRQAVPATGFEPEVHQFISELRAAAERSREWGAFSNELASLVRMTEHASARVWEETRLGCLGSSEAELELETLVAERIVEEELVGWQSSYPAARSSRRPISEPNILPFEGEERHSMIVLRTGNVLSKLRTA
ncbi:MAG: hypothetical protein ABJB12_04520 [Pseudomonadota bacterium]